MKSAVLVLVVLLAAPMAAQCTNVTFTSYGTACSNAGFPASLTGSFDATSCTATLTLNAFSGCCNTFEQFNVWAIGWQQAQILIPPPNPNSCLLLNTADIILMQTPATQNTFTFVVPPGLSGITVYAQSAKMYFTTIGMTMDLSITEGVQVDFQ